MVRANRVVHAYVRFSPVFAWDVPSVSFPRSPPFHPPSIPPLQRRSATGMHASDVLVKQLRSSKSSIISGNTAVTNIRRCVTGRRPYELRGFLPAFTQFSPAEFGDATRTLHHRGHSDYHILHTSMSSTSKGDESKYCLRKYGLRVDRCPAASTAATLQRRWSGMPGSSAVVHIGCSEW